MKLKIQVAKFYFQRLFLYCKDIFNKILGLDTIFLSYYHDDCVRRRGI